RARLNNVGWFATAIRTNSTGPNPLLLQSLALPTRDAWLAFGLHHLILGIVMDRTPRDGGRDGEERLERTTVLLVEDDAATREVLAALLTCYGASVVSTDSVAGALRQLDALQPSVLISDIGLPDDDGYALIDRVRRREGRSLQHLPALAISGYGVKKKNFFLIKIRKFTTFQH